MWESVELAVLVLSLDFLVELRVLGGMVDKKKDIRAW